MGGGHGLRVGFTSRVHPIERAHRAHRARRHRRPLHRVRFPATAHRHRHPAKLVCVRPLPRGRERVVCVRCAAPPAAPRVRASVAFSFPLLNTL